MPIITVPRTLSQNQDLIAVPRRIYEEFSNWQKKAKSVKTFKPSKSEKAAILRGRRNFANGKYVTLEKLQHELASRR